MGSDNLPERGLGIGLNRDCNIRVERGESHTPATNVTPERLAGGL